jgi:hypothetical protein
MKYIIYCLIGSIPILGFSMNNDLINFEKPIKAHKIISDATERPQGKSHGTMSFNDGIKGKKYYFFSFIDPQPNGAGFVSLHIPLELALESNQSLCLTVKGLQENPTVFQFIINTTVSLKKDYSYQIKFIVEDKKRTFYFPLRDFLATSRGRPVLGVSPLDTNNIQSIGIRIIGRDKAPDQGFQSGLYGLALYRLFVCNT